MSKDALKQIEEKIAEVQKKHSGLTAQKKAKVSELRQIDEELVKLVGSYQSLMELKDSLTGSDEETVEDAEVEELEEESVEE